MAAFEIESAAPAPSEAGALPRGPVRAPAQGLPALLRAGWAHAVLMRRAVLLVVGVQVLLAAGIALPFYVRVRPLLDGHAHASALAGRPDAADRRLRWEAGLDAGWLADLRRREAPFLEAASASLVALALLAWLFGAVAAGGFLATTPSAEGPAAPTRPGRCARFLAGGGRWFFPMLRVGVLFGLLYAIFGRLVFEVWGDVAGRAEREAASESVPWWGARTREAAFVLLFLWLRTAADLARAHLVVGERRSAVLAFGRALRTWVRHPLRCGGAALAPGLLEVAVVLLIARGVARVPGGEWLEIAVAFLLLQAAVLVRWSARAALLGGYAALVAPRPVAAG